jgi:hypothetical protein
MIKELAAAACEIQASSLQISYVWREHYLRRRQLTVIIGWQGVTLCFQCSLFSMTGDVV